MCKRKLLMAAAGDDGRNMAGCWTDGDGSASSGWPIAHSLAVSNFPSEPRWASGRLDSTVSSHRTGGWDASAVLSVNSDETTLAKLDSNHGLLRVSTPSCSKTDSHPPCASRRLKFIFGKILRHSRFMCFEKIHVLFISSMPTPMSKDETRRASPKRYKLSSQVWGSQIMRLKAIPVPDISSMKPGC